MKAMFRVRTGPWKPGKSWNFCRGPWKSWNLDIYIYIFNHKCTGIQSLHFFGNMGVSLRIKSSWIHWKGPWIWHWKILESPVIWDVKMCMNPVCCCCFDCCHDYYCYWVYEVWNYVKKIHLDGLINISGFALVLENLEGPGIWNFGFQVWIILKVWNSCNLDV